MNRVLVLLLKMREIWYKAGLGYVVCKSQTIMKFSGLLKVGFIKRETGFECVVCIGRSSGSLSNWPSLSCSFGLGRKFVLGYCPSENRVGLLFRSEMPGTCHCQCYDDMQRHGENGGSGCRESRRGV